MLRERDRNMVAAQTRVTQGAPPAKAKRSSLKEIEKRKILENFVENDEALGQLLDFISSHYIQSNESGVQMGGTGGVNPMTGNPNPFTGSNSVSTLTSQNSHARINQLYYAQ